MNIDVFISYHTTTCRDTATAICNKLEGSGIRCWYASRDMVHDAYAGQIYDAIQACKVFLVLLNKEASESEDVLNEINTAIQRVREHADISIMTFRLADNAQISGDAKYYLGRKHWIDGLEPELKERIDELVPQVLSTLGRKIENTTSYKTEPLSPSIRRTVINSNINFVGRNTLLSELSETIKNENTVFIQGIGGIGKSELVRQYIREYGAEYDTVVFLPFHESIIRTINDDGIDGIQITDIKQNQGEDDEAYFYRKLSMINRLISANSLFVLDNYDVLFDEHFDEIIHLGCRLIITTRVDHSESGLPVLHIGELSQLDQLNLMKRYCNQIRNSEDENEAIGILWSAGGHTLTIILLAELMQRKHLRPAAMNRLLKNSGLVTVLNEGTRGNSMTALDRVKKLLNMFSLSDKEKYIMENMSLIPISGIDFGLFIDLCELEDGSIVDDLIRSSWLLYDDILDRIVMHPLIAEMIRHALPVNEQSCNQLLTNLSNYTENSHIRLSDDEIYIYCQIIESIYLINKPLLFGNDQLWINCLGTLCRAGKHELAIKLAEDNIEYQTKIHGELSEVVALSYYKLKDIYYGWGDVDHGLPYGIKALDIIREAKPDSIAHAYLSSSLAISFSYSPDMPLPEEPFKLLQESEKAIDSSNEEESLYFGSRMWNVGIIYNYYSLICVRAKRFEDAIQYAQRSFDAYMKCSLDIERNACGNPLLNMAEAYSLLCDKDNAIRTIQEAMEWRKKDVNPDHINYLRTVLKHEVAVYINLHEYDHAMKILQDLQTKFQSLGYTESPYYEQVVQKMNGIQNILKK